MIALHLDEIDPPAVGLVRIIDLHDNAVSVEKIDHAGNPLTEPFKVSDPYRLVWQWPMVPQRVSMNEIRAKCVPSIRGQSARTIRAFIRDQMRRRAMT